jgi:hypothetical protein
LQPSYAYLFCSAVVPAWDPISEEDRVTTTMMAPLLMTLAFMEGILGVMTTMEDTAAVMATIGEATIEIITSTGESVLHQDSMVRAEAARDLSVRREEVGVISAAEVVGTSVEVATAAATEGVDTVKQIGGG